MDSAILQEYKNKIKIKKRNEKKREKCFKKKSLCKSLQFSSIREIQEK